LKAATENLEFIVRRFLQRPFINYAPSLPRPSPQALSAAFTSAALQGHYVVMRRIYTDLMFDESQLDDLFLKLMNTFEYGTTNERAIISFFVTEKRLSAQVFYDALFIAKQRDIFLDEMKSGEYIEPSKTSCASNMEVLQCSLKSMLTEVYEQGYHQDAHGGKWKVENEAQLGAFVQGLPHSKWSADMLLFRRYKKSKNLFVAELNKRSTASCSDEHCSIIIRKFSGTSSS